LHGIVLVLTLHAIFVFAVAAVTKSGRASWADLPGWLRPFLLATPVAACAIFALCSTQTLQHVGEICKDRAIVKHDRAVQIIALPSVYGCVAMTSLARLYQLTSNQHKTSTAMSWNSSAFEDLEQRYIAKSETCFWVGDLYEAWALYQFAKLTLELIRASVERMRCSANPAQRDNAQALLVSHSAVENIAWLGVMLFLMVCVLQAGWSVYLLTFSEPTSDWSEYHGYVAQFRAAGAVASAGAIWNVHVVESTFNLYFEGYKPLLKFITVKIIVSLAFFQSAVFAVLKAVRQTLPSVAQQVTSNVPIIGQILDFNEVEFQLFYDGLMLYECVFIALLHWCGWSAFEDWYLHDTTGDQEAEQKAEGGPGECKPLLSGQMPSAAKVV